VTRIIRVLAPNPGVYTLEGTNTWIVGGPPVVVIDPGPEEITHLREVAREAGTVAAIVITHHHADHAAGVAAFAEMVLAPVYAQRPEADQLNLHDGQVVMAGSEPITAVHTPGHTPDHTVLFASRSGALFTGDAVLGRGTSLIDPPEGDIAQYLRSLARMRELAPRTIYPGHGATVFDAVAKLDEYLAHRAQRESQVLEVLGSDARTPDELVATIYADYPEDVRPLAARSVLAHLIKLEREGRVARTGAGDRVRFFRAQTHPCARCGRPARGRSPLCDRCSVDVLQEGPAS